MTTNNSVTATKTSTLQSLLRQYNDATTIAAKAEAAYESYTNKAQLFQDLVTSATNDLTLAKAQWAAFLTAKASLNALEQTSDDSNEVAEITFANISKLVKKWERVVQKTLEAADTINLASDYINKRKASNALISNDLVADAAAATKSAASTVTLTINALTSALNTLTASSQAKNSTELTGSYIDMVSSALLQSEANGENSSPKQPHVPLENSLNLMLQQATDKMTKAQTAMNNVSMEVAKAKEELDSANAKVVATQSALSAAQAAVNA